MSESDLQRCPECGRAYSPSVDEAADDTRSSDASGYVRGLSDAADLARKEVEDCEAMLRQTTKLPMTREAILNNQAMANSLESKIRAIISRHEAEVKQ